jgi:cell division inhibitor SulA/protein ImuA
MNLSNLVQQRRDLWRGSDHAPAAGSVVSSGFEQLDRALAGGWPQGAATEILSGGEGMGAMALVLPALAALSGGSRWIALVGPPHIPYAPALAAAGVELSRLLLVWPKHERESLWAVEQALRSGTCGAVLVWPQRGLKPAVLRRLQLAAASGGSLGFLFRTERAAAEYSPSALRLQVRPAAEGMEVELLKRRGGWPGSRIYLKSSS